MEKRIFCNLKRYDEIRDNAFQIWEIEVQAVRMDDEMNVTPELIQNCIDENTYIAQG
ncbi:MAG: hypothetical protein Q4C77_16685 [Eubacteriales bacterium]|nr:hypothetical protein [Eubacteriales bacterium]